MAGQQDLQVLYTNCVLWFAGEAVHEETQIQQDPATCASLQATWPETHSQCYIWLHICKFFWEDAMYWGSMDLRRFLLPIQGQAICMWLTWQELHHSIKSFCYCVSSATYKKKYFVPLCGVISVLLFVLLASSFVFISMLFCVTICGTHYVMHISSQQ